MILQFITRQKCCLLGVARPYLVYKCTVIERLFTIRFMLKKKKNTNSIMKLKHSITIVQAKHLFA